MDPVMGIGLLLLLSYVGGEIARRLSLPSITGHILAGVMFGPSVLNLFDRQTINGFNHFTIVALGLIAVAIGEELNFSEIAKRGKSLAFASFLAASGPMAAVFLVMMLFDQPLALSLLFAGLAVSTAPAGTLAVIREYNSRGPMTSTILATVALNDVYGIIVVGLLVAIIPSLLTPIDVPMWITLLTPLQEVVGSVFLGLLLGFSFHYFILVVAWRDPVAKSRRELLLLILGVTLLGSALALMLHLSPLLVNMTIGCVLTNVSPIKEEIFDSFYEIELIVYAMFFALAGAAIHLDLLPQMGLVGIGYIICRSIGKIGGASLGAWLGGADPLVQRYLGFGLISQAGIAIGLTILVQERFPELAAPLGTVIFSTVVVNELIGPLLLKFAILKAGEARSGVSGSGS